jgi:hypothetical protein
LRIIENEYWRRSITGSFAVSGLLYSAATHKALVLYVAVAQRPQTNLDTCCLNGLTESVPKRTMIGL